MTTGEIQSPGLALCASSDLADRGKAVVFDVMLWDQPSRAFVMRFDGKLVAYLNRCAHVPTEMDWQPGEFLCEERRWIICSIHGAAYEPSDGYCISGPCRGRRLIPVKVFEMAGQVFWQPDEQVQPLPAKPATASLSSISACPPPGGKN